MYVINVLDPCGISSVAEAAGDCCKSIKWSRSWQSLLQNPPWLLKNAALVRNIRVEQGTKRLSRLMIKTGRKCLHRCVWLQLCLSFPGSQVCPRKQPGSGSQHPRILFSRRSARNSQGSCSLNLRAAEEKPPWASGGQGCPDTTMISCSRAGRREGSCSQWVWAVHTPAAPAPFPGQLGSRALPLLLQLVPVFSSLDNWHSIINRPCCWVLCSAKPHRSGCLQIELLSKFKLLLAAKLIFSP